MLLGVTQKEYAQFIDMPYKALLNIEYNKKIPMKRMSKNSKSIKSKLI